MESLRHLVDEKPLVIFSRSNCCMCHSMKQLVRSYGANATVYELDQTSNGDDIEEALQGIGNRPSVPAVFIGQRFIGGAKEVISLQVQGKLMPLLKDAGGRISQWGRNAEKEIYFGPLADDNDSRIMESLRHLVDEKPLVIFSRSNCCMCHSMKQLVRSYGANATVYELDQTSNGDDIEEALQGIGNRPSVPAVFIGQRFIGGAKEVISLQVQGKLMPLLKDAGAIWI